MLAARQFDHYEENLDEVLTLVDVLNSKVIVSPDSLTSLTRAVEDLTADIEKGHGRKSDAHQLADLTRDIAFTVGRVRDRYIINRNARLLEEAVLKFSAVASAQLGADQFRDVRRPLFRHLAQIDSIVASIQPDGSTESLEYITMYLRLASARIRNLRAYIGRLLNVYEIADMEHVLMSVLTRMLQIVEAVDVSTDRVAGALMEQIVSARGELTHNADVITAPIGNHTAKLIALSDASMAILNRMYTTKRGSRTAAASPSSMVDQVMAQFTTKSIEPAYASSSRSAE